MPHYVRNLHSEADDVIYSHKLSTAQLLIIFAVGSDIAITAPSKFAAASSKCSWSCHLLYSTCSLLRTPELLHRCVKGMVEGVGGTKECDIFNLSRYYQVPQSSTVLWHAKTSYFLNFLITYKVDKVVDSVTP